MRDRTYILFKRRGIFHLLVSVAVCFPVFVQAAGPTANPAKPQEMLELPSMPETSAPAVAKPATPAVPSLPPSAVPEGLPTANQQAPQTMPAQSVPAGLPALPGSPPVQVPVSATHPDNTPEKMSVLPDISTGINSVVLPIPKASVDSSSLPAMPAMGSNKVPPDYNTNLTLMFNNDEMAILAQIIKAYDAYEPSKQAVQPKDDMSGLLTGLQDKTVQPAPSRLRNVYLGEIVYYSPSNWLVRVNGRIITSSSNLPTNEFYISKISRKEVEMIWKPSVMGELLDRWNQLTDNGKNPLPNIAVQNGLIRLNLHTNQTFLVRSVAIREGLIKSSPELDSQPKADTNLLPAQPSGSL